MSRTSHFVARETPAEIHPFTSRLHQSRYKGQAIGQGHPAPASRRHPAPAQCAVRARIARLPVRLAQRFSFMSLLPRMKVSLYEDRRALWRRWPDRGHFNLLTVNRYERQSCQRCLFHKAHQRLTTRGVQACTASCCDFGFREVDRLTRHKRRSAYLSIE